MISLRAFLFVRCHFPPPEGEGRVGAVAHHEVVCSCGSAAPISIFPLTGEEVLLTEVISLSSAAPVAVQRGFHRGGGVA